MSSVPHRGSNADDEGAKVGSRERLSDDVMFVDSSQQDISGGRWSDSDGEEDSKDGNWTNQLSWLSNIVEPAMSMNKGPPPPGMPFDSVSTPSLSLRHLPDFAYFRD